ncbi:MAG: RsmB/NOP family class I SAM-dependent RNA methyltransferase [Flavobacteriaceae bacterium]
MQTGGRLQAAIEVLSDIAERKRPAADALRDWGTSHRFAGSGDRAAIGNLVFDCLRRRASLAWIMDSESPRAAVLACYARGWNMGAERLDAAIAGDRHAPEAPDDAEHIRLRTGTLDDAPAHVRADCPQWLWPQFQAAFGDAAADEIAALAERAPVDLRANALKADRDKVLKGLSHLKPEPLDFLENGVRIAAGEGFARQPTIEAEAGWRKGWFEVQDAGSQLAAALSGVTGGMQVADYCAGAGGKTLALAALMGNTGQIHAYDADRNRLANIHDRLQRAGVRNVQVRDPARYPDFADLEGRMELVLVDAPCTGAGTWRRRPDAKWRLSPEALETRLAEQAAILDAASALVAPGGRLVYVTCSLIAAENGAQARAFLDRDDRFRAVDPLANLEASLPAEHAALLRERSLADAQGLTLTPGRTGTDGFHIACMVRQG